MKKLMIIAAVCAMASVAQAYAVNWSASNVRIPVAKDVNVSETGITTTSGSSKFAAEALTLSLFYIDKNGTEQLVLSQKNNSEGAMSATPAIEFNDTLYKAIIADNGGTSVDFVMRTSYSTDKGTYDFYMSKTGVDITATETKCPAWHEHEQRHVELHGQCRPRADLWSPPASRRCGPRAPSPSRLIA